MAAHASQFDPLRTNAGSVHDKVESHVDQQMPSGLISIHRAALFRLFPPARKRDHPQDSVESLQKQLTSLKRRRMFLASEIDQFESQELVTTVADELEGMHDDNPPPYMHSFDTDRLKVPKQAVQHDNLAFRMNKLRTQRRIVGSHRLAGISLLPRQEDNTLGVRMDISVNGRYVARHVIFFRIMAIKDQMFLRLAQHTLPKGIVSKSKTSLEIQKEQLNDGQGVMGKLREWVGELYDACYALAVRKAACEWLSSQAKNKDEGRTIIQNVIFNDTFDTTSFRIVIWNSTQRDTVHNSSPVGVDLKLCHANPNVARPTQVKARRIKSPQSRGEEANSRNVHVGQHNIDVPEVSDDEDDEQGETFQRIKNAFLCFDMPIALEEAAQLLETMLN